VRTQIPRWAIALDIGAAIIGVALVTAAVLVDVVWVVAFPPA
jgi:hypothetical protein